MTTEMRTAITITSVILGVALIMTSLFMHWYVVLYILGFCAATFYVGVGLFWLGNMWYHAIKSVRKEK